MSYDYSITAKEAQTRAKAAFDKFNEEHDNIAGMLEKYEQDVEKLAKSN